MKRQHPELVVGGFTLAVALPSALGELLVDAAIPAASHTFFEVWTLRAERSCSLHCISLHMLVVVVLVVVLVWFWC